MSCNWSVSHLHLHGLMPLSVLGWTDPEDQKLLQLLSYCKQSKRHIRQEHATLRVAGSRQSSAAPCTHAIMHLGHPMSEQAVEPQPQHCCHDVDSHASALDACVMRATCAFPPASILSGCSQLRSCRRSSKFVNPSKATSKHKASEGQAQPSSQSLERHASQPVPNSCCTGEHQ